jgi:transposase
MGNPAGVRRDFDALERRRIQAAELLAEGFNQSKVARHLKVSAQSVSRWARQIAEGGREGLRQVGRAGRKPLLSPAQRERLRSLLQRGPEALGYETGLWTSARLAHLIEQEFRIRYHPGHVWRILISPGWSCQRPTGRALERNEEQIRHWKRHRWTAIKNKPARRAARSSSSTKAD